MQAGSRGTREAALREGRAGRRDCESRDLELRKQAHHVFRKNEAYHLAVVGAVKSGVGKTDKCSGLKARLWGPDCVPEASAAIEGV